MNCAIGIINPTEKICDACGHRCTSKGLSAQLAYAISCLGSGDTEKAKDIILRLAEVIR